MPGTNPPTTSLFTFSSLSAQGPPLIVGWVLASWFFWHWLRRPMLLGRGCSLLQDNESSMKWVPGPGSGRGYERRKRWRLIMSVVEWFGRDYRHCQTQRTAGAQINRSAPHVFSFCLILEQQTTQKHESPCQTIMGPKNTSYIVCRWCKSIKSYQAKKTRVIEKCWSQVARIFPKGICISLFSFITQTKHILALRFADYSSCISLIFKNTSSVMHKHPHTHRTPFWGLNVPSVVKSQWMGHGIMC